MDFLTLMGIIFVGLILFGLCYFIISVVCNPTPGNNAYCRVTNRAKRELEQELYKGMMGIVTFLLAVVVLSLASCGR